MSVIIMIINANTANRSIDEWNARNRMDMIQYQTYMNNNQIKVSQDTSGRHVRFGTVDVNYVQTDHRYSPLADTMCESHASEECIDLSKLDRIQECKELRSVSAHKRQFDQTGKYVKVTCTSDSEAGESVMPREWFPEVPIQKSSEVHSTYASADGSVLRNHGRKVLEGFNPGGAKVRMEWQLAKVTKPLMSVGHITDKGHRVVFDNTESGGGFTLHKDSGTKTSLRKRNGTYEFDVWVKIPENKKIAAIEAAGSRHFPGQGNP